MAVGHIGEHGRPMPVALLGQRARRLDLACALIDAALHQLLDARQLGLAVDRAHVGVLVHRVADADALDAHAQLLDEHVVDAFLQQQSRTGAADVALVEEDAAHHAVDGLVDRRIVEHDVRRLAAELERQLLARARELLLDLLADFGAAGERDLREVLVRDERCPGAAVAGDDVDDARRQPRLLEDLAEPQGRERRRLRGLQHDGVAACERWRNLPRRHQQREVPRDHLADDAQRLGLAAGEREVELVGPTCVVEEVLRRERNVDVARFADRLAAVHRFEAREFARALLHDARDAEQVAAALFARQLAPCRQRLLRGANGSVDVLLRALRHFADRLLGRRIDRREVLTGLWRAELAADEAAVAFLDTEVVRAFLRWRVVPHSAKRQFARGGRRRIGRLRVVVGHGLTTVGRGARRCTPTRIDGA